MKNFIVNILKTATIAVLVGTSLALISSGAAWYVNLSIVMLTLLVTFFLIIPEDER